MTLDLQAISTEQTNFLRKSLTDPNSRATDTTQTFEGDGTTTKFTITNGITGSNRVLYITSVTVDSVTQTWGSDYVGIFGGDDKNKISFVTAPDNGTSIIVSYGYGTSAMVYPGFPRVDLSYDAYPRVAVTFMHTSSPISAVRYVLSTDVRITCLVLSKSNYQTDSILKELRDAYLSTYKFNYLRFVHISSIAEVSLSDDHTKDFVVKALELVGKFNYEKT